MVAVSPFLWLAVGFILKTGCYSVLENILTKHLNKHCARECHYPPPGWTHRRCLRAKLPRALKNGDACLCGRWICDLGVVTTGRPAGSCNEEKPLFSLKVLGVGGTPGMVIGSPSVGGRRQPLKHGNGGQQRVDGASGDPAGENMAESPVKWTCGHCHLPVGPAFSQVWLSCDSCIFLYFE